MLPLKDDRRNNITIVEGNTCSCIIVGFVLLTIITLGAVIWGPRLREKRSRFGHNFADINIGIGKNQGNSNQTIPNQYNNPEKNFNNKESKPR